MKKIRSNFVWVCSGRINLNESMWEMPKSCCVKNESHQNSVEMWKLFSYIVYNTPWNPLFCDLQTVSINLMGHMYLATHFCSVRGLENESNGNWPIFWRLNTGVDPKRHQAKFRERAWSTADQTAWPHTEICFVELIEKNVRVQGRFLDKNKRQLCW